MKVIEENGRPTARKKEADCGRGCGCDGGGMARETSAGAREARRRSTGAAEKKALHRRAPGDPYGPCGCDGSCGCGGAVGRKRDKSLRR